jgi:hypothetical protein
MRFSWLMLFSTVALAQQNGAPCGDIDGLGECQGTDVVFCSVDNTIIRDTCANNVINPELTLTGGQCANVDASFGTWCVYPSGICAFFADADSNEVVQYGCGPANIDTDMVCDLGDGCVDVGNGDGDCIAADEGTCIGNRVILSCSPFGQALTFDCSDELGTCNAGLCIMPVGAFCSDNLFQCAAGLLCDGPVDDRSCRDPNAMTEGEGEPVGEGEGEPLGEGEGEVAGEGEGEGPAEGEGEEGEGEEGEGDGQAEGEGEGTAGEGEDEEGGTLRPRLPPREEPAPPPSGCEGCQQFGSASWVMALALLRRRW